MTNKKIWVQEAKGAKPYTWTTQTMVDLGMGRVTHSFLVIQECSYPLFGHDLLAKMKAQTHFSDEGDKLLSKDGKPIHVLVTSSLTEEYRLHQWP